MYNWFLIKPPFSNYQSGQRKCPFNFECSFVSTVTLWMPIFPKHILIDTFHLINIFLYIICSHMHPGEVHNYLFRKGKMKSFQLKRWTKKYSCISALEEAPPIWMNSELRWIIALLIPQIVWPLGIRLKQIFSLSLSPRAFNYTVDCFMAVKEAFYSLSFLRLHAALLLYYYDLLFVGFYLLFYDSAPCLKPTF